MNLNDMNDFTFSLADDTENGYYFILKDTLHHLDYNVMLVKDTGDITVNGTYINDLPRDGISQRLTNIIAPRVEYFLAQKSVTDKMAKQHEESKPEVKKPETKKTETKKSETKKTSTKKKTAKEK